MKNPIVLFSFLLCLVLASCSSGRYAYNENYEDDELYYASNDPDEYNYSNYVNENETVEDDYYSEDYSGSNEYQEYDDGGDTYVTNNYYQNDYWNWRNRNRCGNGFNMGWNSWSGWNIGYSWGYSPYNYGYSAFNNPYGFGYGYGSFYNPWDPWYNPYNNYNPYCYNGYGYGYGSGYGWGGYGGYAGNGINNDFYGNAGDGGSHYGHITPISSGSGHNSQYDGGTILVQANDKDVSTHADAARPGVSMVPVDKNPVEHVSQGGETSRRPEILASAKDPVISTSRPSTNQDERPTASNNPARINDHYYWVAPERDNSSSTSRNSSRTDFSSRNRPNTSSTNNDRGLNFNSSSRSPSSNNSGETRPSSNSGSRNNDRGSSWGNSRPSSNSSWGNSSKGSNSNSRSNSSSTKSSSSRSSNSPSTRSSSSSRSSSSKRSNSSGGSRKR